MHICTPRNAHMHMFGNMLPKVWDGMPRRVDLTENKKLRIADLYHNSNRSVGYIAEREGVSLRTVHNYKNYGNFQSSNDVPEENIPQSSQTFEEPEESYQDNDIQEEETTGEDDVYEESDDENDEYPEKKSIEYVEVTACPDCGAPKSEWATIEQAIEAGYNIDEGQQRFYSYVCLNPKCHQLIPEKRCYIEGTCPGCGSTSIDWMPIEDAYVSDEDKREYDFVCVDCWELIKL